MIFRTSIASILTASLLLVGATLVGATLVGATGSCSKDKKKVEKPTELTSGDAEPSGASDEEKEPATEIAEGEIREALLILRRVHFPYDASTLVPESRDALTDAAAKLVKHPDVAIFVQGHADARGTTEYNIALGDRRAQVVAEYLKRSGIDGARLKVISYGEEKPLAASEAANALAKNRRVDFELMRGNIKLIIEDGTAVDDGGSAIGVSSTPSPDPAPAPAPSPK